LRSRLPKPVGSTDSDDQVVLPTPDGASVVVARGDAAYRVSLMEPSVIDAVTGPVAAVPPIPDSWQKMILLPDFDGAAIIALRIHSSRRPGTESPTTAFPVLHASTRARGASPTC